MSCVAVKVTNKEIQFAADSIVVMGNTKVNTPTTQPKLTKINNIIIGGCGSFSEIGLMFQFAETHRPDDNSIRAIRQFFVEFGEWKQKYGERFLCENSYIIGYEGKCYSYICNCLEEIKDYCTIGAGMDYALAALYLGKSARDAIKVSCALSCYVAEPIVEYKMSRE